MLCGILSLRSHTAAEASLKSPHLVQSGFNNHCPDLLFPVLGWQAWVTIPASIWCFDLPLELHAKNQFSSPKPLNKNTWDSLLSADHLGKHAEQDLLITCYSRNCRVRFVPDQIIDFCILTHKSTSEIQRTTETFINPSLLGIYCLSDYQRDAMFINLFSIYKTRYL